MSMIHCELCGRLVDSDDDPECIQEVENPLTHGIPKSVVACESCRERNAIGEFSVERTA